MDEDKQARRQLSVAVPDELRALLEASARQSIRSLAGEIVWRLRCSFDEAAQSTGQRPSAR
jgi:hypothetical protein